MMAVVKFVAGSNWIQPVVSVWFPPASMSASLAVALRRTVVAATTFS